MEQILKIVVDAMGGDHAPEAVVTGAVDAAKELGAHLILIGLEDEIKFELSKLSYPKEYIEVIHAPEVITMNDPATISIRGDWAVATSGAYEQYVDADGVRYHHILDPRTGAPSRGGTASASVIAPTALIADAYATAIFVIGPTRGLPLCEATVGLDCFLIGDDGSWHITTGARALITQKLRQPTESLLTLKPEPTKN